MRTLFSFSKPRNGKTKTTIKRKKENMAAGSLEANMQVIVFISFQIPVKPVFLDALLLLDVPVTANCSGGPL